MSAPIRITLGGYQGPASVHTRGLELLRDALLRRVGDKVDVVLKPNLGAQGHKTSDLAELTESGGIDGCYLSSSYLAERVPALSLFDMPFAAPDRDRALALLDGALGARFAQDIETKTGLTLLGTWDNGVRHMATRDRVLRHPDDCKGLVLRTLPSADHQRVFAALGFVPRVVDAKDLHQAVARGDVDAQENPLTNTLNFDLHGPLPVITLTAHLMGVALVLFNRARFDSWPADVRTAVKQSVAETSSRQRELAREDDGRSAQALKDAGAQLNTLTDAQIADWQAAAAPAVAHNRARLDADLLALFEADSAGVTSQDNNDKQSSVTPWAPTSQGTACIDGGRP